MIAASPDRTDALSTDDVVLVTGSTSGIGREIANNVAAAGATVLVHGRDREAGRATVDALPGDDHAFYRADFADLSAVRDLAAAVRDDIDALHGLVNNAGTWQRERRLVSVPGCEDGVETTFAVNHLAPFLLTHLLCDRLRAGGDAGGDEGDPARVVAVSSEVHMRADLTLSGARGPDGPAGMAAYAQSKLANVMFTYGLARRLPDGVVANACHPGATPATALAREASPLMTLGWRLFGLVGKVVDVTDSTAEAAATPTYLVGSRAAADANGQYFEDCERSRSAEASHDRSAQRDLWERSSEWVALSEDERERLAA